MSDLTRLTIAEAREKLRAREISATEITDAYLAAIDRANPVIASNGASANRIPTTSANPVITNAAAPSRMPENLLPQPFTTSQARVRLGTSRRVVLARQVVIATGKAACRKALTKLLQERINMAILVSRRG